MRRFLRWSAMVLVGLVLAAYAGAAGYMAWNQRSFLYRPMPQRPDVTLASLPGAVETELVARDGARLVGWHVPARQEGRPVYLYFHGNAGNLLRRADRFRQMTADGSGLLAYHYRGYGGSDGRPREADLHRDAEQAWNEAQRLFPGRRIVIFGESLGSGVATRLASRQKAAALVLDCPFVSTLDMGQARYPWLPVSLLLVDTFRSDLAIRDVFAPVFIMHGERDHVVPFVQGQRLFEMAREPKRFAAFPQARHVDNFRFGAMDQIRAYLNEVAGFPP